MSTQGNLSAAAHRAGLDWFAPREAQLEGALRSRFRGSAAPGTLESTGAGFLLHLTVAGELPALDVEMRSEDGWLLCAARLEPSSAADGKS